MPSQQEVEDATSFTLSFGGVEFCLVPTATRGKISANDHNDIMSIAKICNGEVLINLNNFVGTLRVKNHKIGGGGIVEKNGCASASDLMPESDGHIAMEDKNLPQDNINNNNNNNSSSIIETPSSLPKHTEKLGEETEAAALAALPPPPLSAPNPVEDSPSPQAKGCIEEEEDEDDELPVQVAEKPRQKPRRGQQKLNFGKRQTKKKATSKLSASSKRRSSPKANDLEQPTDNSRKKSRRTNYKLQEKVKPDKTAEFNDLFDEQKTGPDNNNNNDNSFTMASMGQSMLSSQENESIKESYSNDLSLDLSNMEYPKADEKLESKPKEDTTTIATKKTDESSAPCPRWGQTMTMIDHKRLIVYGGQTIEKDSDEPKPLADLFVYDLMERTWTKPVNCDGIARTWHTADFLPDRQLLLCFGGEVLNESTGKMTTTDQVMVLDCEIMLWYPPTVTGLVPSGRSGHSGCVLPQTNELVVFGGVKNGKWLNSVSILDTNRWRWSALKAVGDAPPPRSYHSATALGTDTNPRVVIFGGNNGSKCFNGVHILEGAGEDNKKKWVWSNPKCKGEAPSPRTGHDATLLNDGSTILVYGGWDPNTEDENGDDLIFGDSFLLDTKTWTWRKGPKPRYEKSKASVNAANGGAERVGHSAVLAPGSKGVQVLAFGGRVQEGKFADDFQSLTVPL